MLVTVAASLPRGSSTAAEEAQFLATVLQSDAKQVFTPSVFGEVSLVGVSAAPAASASVSTAAAHTAGGSPASFLTAQQQQQQEGSELAEGEHFASPAASVEGPAMSVAATVAAASAAATVAASPSPHAAAAGGAGGRVEEFTAAQRAERGIRAQPALATVVPVPAEADTKAAAVEEAAMDEELPTELEFR